MSTLQQATALRKASRITAQRVALRGEIVQFGSTDQGRAILADAIVSMPDWLESVDVEKLLKFAPGIGPGIAAAILRRAGIYTRRSLRQLSGRQRLVLSESVLTCDQSWCIDTTDEEAA